MRTFKIEWRINQWRQPLDPKRSEWKSINGEEWSLEEHANLRMKGYWEKLGFPFDFRVVEVAPHESMKSEPCAS